VGARRFLFYLLLVGFLVRVVYLNQVAALPFFHEPVGDSAIYLDRAREILAGDLVAGRPFFYGGILYPYVLAASLLLFGPNLYPIALIQVGLGCALAWAMYRLAKAAVPGPTGETAGLISAAMTVLYGPLAFLEADILMISWALLFEMLSGWLLLASIQPIGSGRRAIQLAAAGVGLGLAASDRPNLIALVPAFAVWVLCFAPRGARLKSAAALLVGGALVPGLVAGMNRAASGRWVLLTTSTGINFHIGNHEGARGTFDEPWSSRLTEFTASHTDLEESSLLMAERMSGHRLDAVEASSFFLAEGLRFLRDHAGQAARLYVRKLRLLVSSSEVPNHLDFAFMRSLAPALWLMPLCFGLVAPLAAYGFFSPEAREMMFRPARALLAILVLVPLATVLPFFVTDRYRIPAVPPLIVVAACGLIELVRMYRARASRRQASLRMVCVGLLGLAMFAGGTEFDASRDAWMMAQAYKKQGNLTAAARWYERASASSPEDAVIRNNLGVVYTGQGENARAEAEYRESIRLDPRLALPRRNLGLLLMRQGRAAEAFDHLALAEAADPGDVEVAKALAVIHMARGEIRAARARALTVLAAEPADPTALGVLRGTDGTVP